MYVCVCVHEVPTKCFFASNVKASNQFLLVYFLLHRMTDKKLNLVIGNLGQYEIHNFASGTQLQITNLQYTWKF